MNLIIVINKYKKYSNYLNCIILFVCGLIDIFYEHVFKLYRILVKWSKHNFSEDVIICVICPTLQHFFCEVYCK